MSFWGKLSEDRRQQLPLADHCVDVASVFRALCDLPAIRRSLGLGIDGTVSLPRACGDRPGVDIPVETQEMPPPRMRGSTATTS